MGKPKRHRPGDSRHAGDRRHWDDDRDNHKPAPAFPPSAYIRGYEAELLRPDGLSHPPRLIKRESGDPSEPEVWADRHDILHLVASLPRARPPSPTGSLSSSWSLPTDAEEMFDVSGDEEIAAHDTARRKLLVEALREERLREREREDREAKETEERAKRERDNAEPPADVLKLMTHTAKSLAASPNPAMLEMRIVTRHASDARFAFLRAGGPWSGAWSRVRAQEGVAPAPGALGAGRAADAKPKPPVSAAAKGIGLPSASMGGLMGGYGSDSDAESDHSADEIPDSPHDDPPPPPPGSPPPSPPPSPP
ncbi:uncharacterized protein LOC62_01G000651 [Vanrija pseudolonga]|uniref:SURP motif domain-containing protein n=1 Tax=Vanrija pseudolonga TaxID=143232 RepID=A0AAF1BF92_9TREE|nr:hypothetical protein LOC62_01G000651 [Vanrija pseudolonga]